MELPAVGPMLDFSASRIIQGDCRVVLAAAPRARLLLTDPPYNIGFAGYESHDDNMTTLEYQAMLAGLRGKAEVVVIIQYPEETMRHVVPALGVPTEVIAWCYNSNINRRFRLASIYGAKPDFRRVRQPYKNPNDKRVKKLIEAGSEGGPVYDWWQDIQLVKNVSREKGIHPCPIPEKLAERIILLLTNPGDVVVDPFGGGGTVAVAAKKCGRIGIAIEKEPLYAEHARARLDAVEGK